jgi:undecaprenyl-diphosphatase
MNKTALIWKWMIYGAIATVAITTAFYLDAPVRAWVVEHHNRAAQQFMRNVSRFGDWPEHVVAGLAGLAIAYWRRNKRWARVCLTMILACALAGIVARGTKFASGRARPSVKQELGWNGPRASEKYHSFPSGHTAATTAFFGVLLLARRRVGLLLLPVPLLIGTSRLYVGAHYLSDVVCAAVMGILCAWLCARMSQISNLKSDI